MHKQKLLVVDDISSIRFAIQDYLSSLFEVVTANDGQEAVQIIENQDSKTQFNLILSDIRMPGMTGIELIQNIQNRFPSIQYALMTAYDVNDYVEYARKYRIWNIIPKSAFLDLEFVKVMAQKLTGSELFGFNLQFPDLIEQQVSLGQVYRMHRDVDFRLPDLTFSECSISSDEERFRICDMVSELLRRHRAPALIRVILEELTMNARDYGSNQFERPIQLGFGCYKDNLLFSVSDSLGSLDRSEILYWLERNVTYDDAGRPKSLTDSHGRGLFISRENLDHLIFNIQQDVKTEILGILQPDAEFRNKAISIYYRDKEGRIRQ